MKPASHSGRSVASHAATVRALLGAALLAITSVARAQDTARVRPGDSTARPLPPMVTVTREAPRSVLDVPYGVTRTRPDSERPGASHTHIEQTLALIPGVTVSDRTNPSQDARIAIRGFGARSAFGVRSIRVLRDGMPLTLPDGQTPIDYLDLESVGAVEVIRGSASALYGNASGGVIDLQSAPPPASVFGVQGRTWAGSGATRRYTALFGGSRGATFYQGNVGRTSADGFREYSRQRLTNAFVRAGATVHGTDLRVIGMGLDMPVADNPGALTRAQLDSAPEQADPASVLKHARKAVHQVQIGLSASHGFANGGELYAEAYGGTRNLFNPLTFAVIGIARRQGGASLRATRTVASARVSQQITAGVDYQFLNDARKNWANCNGIGTATANCATPDVDRGALQLDQRELVRSIGPYVRDELTAGRVGLSAGLRADNVRFQVRDHFLADGSDDSGVRTLRALSPMLGASWRVAPNASVYTSVATAFETPTTTELGNQADGSAGLNRDLKPQTSVTYEIGSKALWTRHLSLALALFDTEVRDELIPFEIPDGQGRTYYRNAGRTRRQGAEIAASRAIGHVDLALSYALSRFRFRDFAVDAAQYAGHAIPGIPEHQAQASATWRLPHGYIVGEVSAKSRVWVNDANVAAAPGYAVFNLRAGGLAIFGRPWLSPVLGVQNLFDHHYAGSVAINASGSSVAGTKFYEPAPGRTWLIGLSAATVPW
jgi:iron complex outermembrane receptor protein